MPILLSILVIICSCSYFQLSTAEKYEEGHCIMHGYCEEDRPDLFCVHKRPPAPLEPLEGDTNNTNAIKILKKWCPEFAVGENPHVCCTTKTLIYYESLLELLNAIGVFRCPSCSHNGNTGTCQALCSPMQNKYIEITKTTKLESGKEKIENITVIISKKVAHMHYNSCRGLRGFIPGTYLLDFGLCGPWGHKYCTMERFIEFIGTKIEDGGFSPYSIHSMYTMEDTVEAYGRTMYPINFHAKKCSESPGPGQDACSCSDCEEACPVGSLDPPVLPPPTQHFLILGWDGYAVSAAISFVCLLLLFAIFILFKKIREIRCDVDGPPRNKAPSLIQRWGIHLEDQVEKNFRAWGLFVTRHPLSVMTASLLTSFALCLGVLKFELTADPIELWVSERSQARKDMNYFNEHFGPFYRLEQMIVTPKNRDNFYHRAVIHHEIVNVSLGPIFRRDFLLAALALQTKVENLSVELENKSVVHLKDICLSPLSPLNDNCAIQSIFGFIKNSPQLLDSEMKYVSKLLSCSNLPQDQKCFAPYGGPIESADVVLGGFGDNGYEKAEALVITIPIVNFNDKDKNLKARIWEQQFLDFLEGYSHPLLDIAYRAERSLEDEIQRLSSSEIPLVVFSYVVMFCYITLTLGEYHNCRTLLLHSKLALGFFGVSLVLMSVFASVGVFCFLVGVPTTLIVIEVLPFLVLAVGVDNIFILVQAYQRSDKHPGDSLEDKLSYVVGNVAPSMLLSTCSMCSCFFIGAITETPAVQQFALYAGVALIINFLLQMTCFLAFFYLDSKRQENFRLDVCCCCSVSTSNLGNYKREGLIYSFFKKIYSPFIVKKYTRYIVITLFSAWLCFSIGSIDKIEIGLDNKLTVPEDSYLTKHFTYMEKYLAVGPPVYFVITDGYDYTNEMTRKKICSSVASCDPHSLTAELTRMPLAKNRTYIALPPFSWLDNYLEFLKAETCCFTFKDNGTHCPSSVALAHRGMCSSCRSSNPSVLSKEEFAERAGYFLADPPWDRCPKGGKAMYSSAVELISDGEKKRIGATNFMTYHTTLKTSKDFYEALRWSRIISENLTKLISSGDSDVRVFPYSMVHPFFEQYLTMWEDSVWSLALCVSAVFFTALILMGLDFRSALIILVCICSILIDLMGLMYWWNITLNPATLINLVVGVGISVEFCSHITRSFTMSRKSSLVNRTQDALCQIGSSVLSGITLTDCGILILAFAKSRIFRVIYFQMYLGIIVIGTLHGLVLLPVLLSYFGSPIKRMNIVSACEKKGHKSNNDEQTYDFILQPNGNSTLTQ